MPTESLVSPAHATGPRTAARGATALPSWLPRPLRSRIETLQRDARTVALGLLGQHPPPLVPRVRRAAAPRTLAARELRVVEVTRETPDAVTLTLEDPAGAAIAYEAGQFFTLLVEVDGETLRRAYSASSAPHDPRRVALTIKRVAGGRVSTRLVEGARAGDLVRVLGPSGQLVAPPATAPRHLVLVAGGSGITPLISIARDVLAREPASRVSLVYGNRSARDVIFRDALADLAHAHTPRLVVRHVLEDTSGDLPARRGMLDAGTCGAELEALGDLDGALYFVCGPEPMRVAVRAALDARGVAPASIREERFTQPHLRAADLAAPLAPQLVRFVRNGAREHVVAPGRTLLEGGLEAGVAMPFSCTMGGCGACKVKLAAGAVHMEEPSCLTREERDAGFVLACVARPTEPCVVEVP